MKESGAKKVTYIGHSQGTSQMFYALANNLDFIKQRVNLFVAFAPIARMTHVSAKLEDIAKLIGPKFIEEIADGIKMYAIYSPKQKQAENEVLLDMKANPKMDDLITKLEAALRPKSAFNNAERSLAASNW